MKLAWFSQHLSCHLQRRHYNTWVLQPMFTVSLKSNFISRLFSSGSNLSVREYTLCCGKFRSVFLCPVWIDLIKWDLEQISYALCEFPKFPFLFCIVGKSVLIVEVGRIVNWRKIIFAVFNPLYSHNFESSLSIKALHKHEYILSYLNCKYHL